MRQSARRLSRDSRGPEWSPADRNGDQPTEEGEQPQLKRLGGLELRQQEVDNGFLVHVPSLMCGGGHMSPGRGGHRSRGKKTKVAEDETGWPRRNCSSEWAEGGDRTRRPRPRRRTERKVKGRGARFNENENLQSDDKDNLREQHRLWKRPVSPTLERPATSFARPIFTIAPGLVMAQLEDLLIELNERHEILAVNDLMSPIRQQAMEANVNESRQLQGGRGRRYSITAALGLDENSTRSNRSSGSVSEAYSMEETNGLWKCLLGDSMKWDLPNLYETWKSTDFVGQGHNFYGYLALGVMYGEVGSMECEPDFSETAKDLEPDFGAIPASNYQALFQELYCCHRSLPLSNACRDALRLLHMLFFLQRQRMWEHLTSYNKFLIVIYALGRNVGFFGIDSTLALTLISRGNGAILREYDQFFGEVEQHWGDQIYLQTKKNATSFSETSWWNSDDHLLMQPLNLDIDMSRVYKRVTCRGGRVAAGSERRLPPLCGCASRSSSEDDNTISHRSQSSKLLEPDSEHDRITCPRLATSPTYRRLRRVETSPKMWKSPSITDVPGDNCIVDSVKVMPIQELYSFAVVQSILRKHMEVGAQSDLKPLLRELRDLFIASDAAVYPAVMKKLNSPLTSQSFMARIVLAALVAEWGLFLLDPEAMDRYLVMMAWSLQGATIRKNPTFYLMKKHSLWEESINPVTDVSIFSGLAILHCAFGQGQQQAAMNYVRPLMRPMFLSAVIRPSMGTIPQEVIVERLTRCDKMIETIGSRLHIIMCHETLPHYNLSMTPRSIRKNRSCRSLFGDTAITSLSNSDEPSELPKPTPLGVLSELWKLTNKILSKKLRVQSLPPNPFTNSERLDYDASDWDGNIMKIWADHGAEFFVHVAESVINFERLVADQKFRKVFRGPSNELATANDVRAFLRGLQSSYFFLPYHNAGHAGMVLHHTLFILRLLGHWSFFNISLKFAVIVTALGHDVSHFGCNSETIFNILNRHGAEAAEIVRDHLNDIVKVWNSFDSSTKELWAVDTSRDCHLEAGETSQWPMLPYAELMHISVTERTLRKYFTVDVYGQEYAETIGNVLRNSIVRTDPGPASRLQVSFDQLYQNSGCFDIYEGISHVLCISDIANTLLTSKGENRHFLSVAVAAEISVTKKDWFHYLRKHDYLNNAAPSCIDCPIPDWVTPETIVFGKDLTDFAIAEGQRSFMDMNLKPLVKHIKGLKLNSSETFWERVQENYFQAGNLSSRLRGSNKGAGGYDISMVAKSHSSSR